MKKKILLLGVTGMLGSEVFNTLSSKHHKYDIITTTRKEFDAEILMQDYINKRDGYFSGFVKRIGDVDYVINTIGVIVPHVMINSTTTFFVNSALPHILERQYGKKLIHITTDCAYGNGGVAPYDEWAHLSPNDIYGLSKSLGEPAGCLTIRTSVIGPELNGGHSGLLGWFLHTAYTGGKIRGFTDHLWNGITTHQFGLACDKIISEGFPGTGVFHVFSDSISKYDMLLAFKEKFGIQCNIEPTSGNPVDRRLSSIRELNDWLRIPSFKKMVEDM